MTESQEHESEWRKLFHVTNVWRKFKAVLRAARIKHFESQMSAVPGEVKLIMFDEIEESEPEQERPRPRFKGVRRLDKTHRWVSEIRPTAGLYNNHTKKKIWLGSFGTEEEAARAFDVGIFFWKEDHSIENFNFPDSPTTLRLLEPNMKGLDESTRFARTKHLAQRAADRAADHRDFSSVSGSRRRDSRNYAQDLPERSH